MYIFTWLVALPCIKFSRNFLIQICIPVSGSKGHGYLWCEASVANGTWQLDRLELEVSKPRTTLTLVPSNDTDNKI